VLAILILFSIPGSTIIAAVIAFGATFFGVFLSFWVERRRKEKEEESQFARMLQSLSVESAVNTGLLTGLTKSAKPGHLSLLEMDTVALEAAIKNPTFLRWADATLVLVMVTVKSELGAMNNFLTVNRDAIAGGHTTTAKGAEVLKARAEANLELLPEMEKILNEKFSKFGVRIEKDSRFEEVKESLKEIARKRNEKLDKIEEIYNEEKETPKKLDTS